MHGQRMHDTRLHTRLPPSFLGKDTWMALQVNVASIRKLCWLLMCVAYFLTCYSWVFVQLSTDEDENWGSLKKVDLT